MGYTIKITRLKKVFGFAIPFLVEVDGEKIGSLPNGKKYECDVKKGTHTVTLKSTEKDVVQEVTLDEHKEVELQIVAKMGLIAARPYIKEIIYRD